MTPARRKLSEWPHDKTSLVRPRMRKRERHVRDNAFAIGDQIEIQSAWCMEHRPPTSKMRLDS